MFSLNKILKTQFLVGVTFLFFTISVLGGGKVEKVTGEYVRAPGPNGNLTPLQITEVAAHEATESSPQIGFYFTHTDSDDDGVYDSWRLIDLDDSENSCVNIYGDGVARVGGLVSEWSDGNRLAGRYLGYDLLDGGQPNTNEYVDFLTIILFSEPDPENPAEILLGLMHWCDTGELLEGVYDGAFPKYVSEGNLKIHNR